MDNKYELLQSLSDNVQAYETGKNVDKGRSDRLHKPELGLHE